VKLILLLIFSVGAGLMAWHRRNKDIEEFADEYVPQPSCKLISGPGVAFYNTTQTLRDTLVRGEDAHRRGEGNAERDAERAGQVKSWFDDYEALDEVDRGVLAKYSISAARVRGVLESIEQEGGSGYRDCHRELNQMARAMSEVRY